MAETAAGSGGRQQPGVAQQLVAMRAYGSGGFFDVGAEAAGAFRFAEDGFVRGEDERGVFTDFNEMGAGSDGGDGGFFHGRVMKNAAHLHVVGDDEAAEGKLVSERAIDPEGRDGCGQRPGVRLAVGLRIGGVRDHDEGQRAMQLAEGKHDPLPRAASRAVDGRRGVVRVERAAA